MRSSLCLITLALVGVALSVLPAAYFQYPANGEAPGWLGWWFVSLRYFAIPLCLVFLGFRGTRLVSWLRLGWGIWISLISLGVLINIQAVPLLRVAYGGIGVSAILVLGLALSVFAGIEAAR
jgi:hypothetical protein